MPPSAQFSSFSLDNKRSSPARPKERTMLSERELILALDWDSSFFRFSATTIPRAARDEIQMTKVLDAERSKVPLFRFGLYRAQNPPFMNVIVVLTHGTCRRNCTTSN